MDIVTLETKSASSNCTANTAGSTSGDWRQSVRAAFRKLPDLCRYLKLDEKIICDSAAVAADFPLFVPQEFAQKIEPGNPRDPLLLQVLPQPSENELQEGFTNDPVGDLAAEQSSGMLQKYAGRALLITTGACAVHCRYCFRRHFPYSDAPKSAQAWQPAMEKIAADRSITEVLLSGGDPLMLVDETLADLVGELGKIPHLRRLRIHTRLPLMIPRRVNEALLNVLQSTRLKTVVVIHANHPHEIDETVASALKRLSGAGAMLLNQSVLLRGINDSAQVLGELSDKLIDSGVVPYYLHQLDRVRGAAHFEVPKARGMEIVSMMRQALSGYAVPRYVEELPGDPNKRVIA